MARADRDAEFLAFAADAEGPLMRTAWLLTGSGDVAAQVVQTALASTYVAWPSVRGGTALAHARRVVATHRLDAWGSTPREVSADRLPHYATPGALPADDRDEVHRWLAGLPDDQRRVVVLRCYDDLSDRETAEVLGLRDDEVASLCSRGLTTLGERTLTARSHLGGFTRPTSAGPERTSPADPQGTLR